MQSTSSIQDFPPNSKRRLELQKQYNAQLQQQQLQQQQKNCDDMICDNDEPPFKRQRPGVAANFFYKVAEFAAYTTTIASEAITTITGSQGSKGRHSTRRDYEYDDIMQIKTDEDDEYDGNDLYDNELDKKGEPTWVENDDDEPPPPYDNSWSMPTQSTTAKLLTPPTLSTPLQEEFAVPKQPSTTNQNVTKSTNPRRKQFRVRRGRRFLRRKSSSTDMSSNINASPPEDDDDIFLKFNCKLTDMIAEGKAALTSTVDVTEVEMMIAEEKEREERILKECGIQTPINRRARRLTGSSTSSDYEYYSSLLGSGVGYSNGYSYGYGYGYGYGV